MGTGYQSYGNIPYSVIADSTTYTYDWFLVVGTSYSQLKIPNMVNQYQINTASLNFSGIIYSTSNTNKTVSWYASTSSGTGDYSGAFQLNAPKFTYDYLAIGMA